MWDQTDGNKLFSVKYIYFEISIGKRRGYIYSTSSDDEWKDKQEEKTARQRKKRVRREGEREREGIERYMQANVECRYGQGNVRKD
jgi:hypothetical protein